MVIVYKVESKCARHQFGLGDIHSDNTWDIIFYGFTFFGASGQNILCIGARRIGFLNQSESFAYFVQDDITFTTRAFTVGKSSIFLLFMCILCFAFYFVVVLIVNLKPWCSFCVVGKMLRYQVKRDRLDPNSPMKCTSTSPKYDIFFSASHTFLFYFAQFGVFSCMGELEIN